VFWGEPEQDSGMMVNTDSAMKPNSFQADRGTAFGLIPE